MSVDLSDITPAPAPDSPAFHARAAAAESRGAARLAAQVDDFFRADADRLDDRTRAAAAATLRANLLALFDDLVQRVVDQVPGLDRSGDQIAEAVQRRLHASGLLRQPVLMEALFARVRQDILGDTLRANRAPDASASVLARLIAERESATADAARAYVTADGRRHPGSPADLPPPCRETLLWSLAAALRDHWAAGSSAQPLVDRALADAVKASIADHDDADRLESIATRLAGLMGGEEGLLAAQLVGALEEGHVALFIALVSAALVLDQSIVRALVLDPADERLWLALRALELDRATIARIGFLLSEADPRRDLEVLAERVTTAAALPPHKAAEGLALLALPAPFRAAIGALDRATAR
ncbi:DUF2336 domain-containing protein [Sphingomonas dokdonensis]|uniref:DUF2336 domain-containing protein n=1 Tax=Sphingomonas dokdonensis TaxID=344880 RepID=A0A245ZN81_9SPHN|nr:DUF2336 domain-containing protein [Sphingomonas dokdonensis]OWK31193.1 hypothetical protein SPDO_12000 [Sphingomonas dokdonensis]